MQKQKLEICAFTLKQNLHFLQQAEENECCEADRSRGGAKGAAGDAAFTGVFALFKRFVVVVKRM